MKRKIFYSKVADSTFDVIDEFLNLMRSEGIEYCVIGGVAMNASQDKTRSKLKKEKDLLDIHRLTEKYPRLKKLIR
ncbi:hypothetical protein IBX73_05670 [candidate division WOR-3 bacterium]|nr:hypothetical protein [candidate division WOR-3 bacterium]